MADPEQIFDPLALRRRRARAVASFDRHDFLFREVGGRLAERLDDVRRDFPLAVEIGCRTGIMGRILRGHPRIGSLIACDLCPGMAARAAGATGAAGAGPAGRPAPALVADPEWLPFRPGSLDLVLSCLDLHSVNDLPGALVQIRRALRPDGLLLAALFGGETLFELREALLAAEIAVGGGASPRVAPFADVRQLGDLLGRAGFALPVVDRDRIAVTWPDALALMRDLRGMGEGNALAARRRAFSRREIFLRAARDYAAARAGPDGRIPATFDIVFLTAWAPAAGQPRPLAPGSATGRLADALGATEQNPEAD